MSEATPTFVDDHGRTWPGPKSIAILDPANPDLFTDREVTDVDVLNELVQIRIGGAAFAWVDPSAGPAPAAPAKRKRRVLKKKEDK